MDLAKRVHRELGLLSRSLFVRILASEKGIMQGGPMDQGRSRHVVACLWASLERMLLLPRGAQRFFANRLPNWPRLIVLLGGGWGEICSGHGQGGTTSKPWALE